MRPADVERFRQLRARYDLSPLAVHANYLINLASADPRIRRQSIAAFRQELERSAAVGADYVILHPGSGRGQTREAAFERFAEAIARSADGFSSGVLTLLLECTAGQGDALGARLEELAQLRRLALRRLSLPVGFCLDTCHLFAAGYDIASEDGLARTLDAARQWLGLENVPLVHVNDSKAPLGSHLDRHEHIGKGRIGEAAFRRILNHPALAGKAFILETPFENEGDDRRNLRTLRRLAGLANYSKNT